MVPDDKSACKSSVKRLEDTLQKKDLGELIKYSLHLMEPSNDNSKMIINTKESETVDFASPLCDEK